MAKITELPQNFMEHFLARNPNALFDSNGYSAQDYRAELRRRIEVANTPPPESHVYDLDPTPIQMRSPYGL